VSIDDDAAFTRSDIIAKTLDIFRADRVGAVAIPYADINKDRRIKQLAPDNEEVWVTARFIGTAHAVRRDIFLQLGGYREALVHQGEEADFCIRMLNAGWVVALGNGSPIHHFESPRRDLTRMDYYGSRNAMLFIRQNVPWPYWALWLPGTAVKVALWSLQPDRLRRRLRAVLDGLVNRTDATRERVSKRTFRIYRELSSKSAVPLDDLIRRWPGHFRDPLSTGPSPASAASERI
jgi:GT2 family glycosyltransferase